MAEEEEEKGVWHLDNKPEFISLGVSTKIAGFKKSGDIPYV
jgi:hypothetical protein